MTQSMGATPQRIIDGPVELEAAVGTALGTSDWVLVDQELIDRFADVTGDGYWGHVDPERSRDTVHKGTIAHGLLTLSLHPQFLYSIVDFRGFSQMFHYGYEKVRFPEVLPAGGSVRMTATLVKAQRTEVGVRATIKLEFESDRSTKPVCVADYIQFFTN